MQDIFNINAVAGVPEPGLNRRPVSLGYGGGLKILWRRPPWVQIPPPAFVLFLKIDFPLREKGILTILVFYVIES